MQKSYWHFKKLKADSFLAYLPFLLLVLYEVVGGTGIEPVATAV